MLPCFLWAQSLKELGPLWGSEEETLGCRGLRRGGQRGSRTPQLSQRGISKVLAGVQSKEAGDLLEFQKMGVGASPWPFKEESGEDLPGDCEGTGAEGTVGPREGG